MQAYSSAAVDVDILDAPAHDGIALQLPHREDGCLRSLTSPPIGGKPMIDNRAAICYNIIWPGNDITEAPA
jgi:hypothetical protein